MTVLIDDGILSTPVDDAYLEHYGRKGQEWYKHKFGDYQDHAQYAAGAKSPSSGNSGSKSGSTIKSKAAASAKDRFKRKTTRVREETKNLNKLHDAQSEYHSEKQRNKQAQKEIIEEQLHRKKSTDKNQKEKPKTLDEEREAIIREAMERLKKEMNQEASQRQAYGMKWQNNQDNQKNQNNQENQKNQDNQKNQSNQNNQNNGNSQNQQFHEQKVEKREKPDLTFRETDTNAELAAKTARLNAERDYYQASINNINAKASFAKATRSTRQVIIDDVKEMAYSTAKSVVGDLAKQYAKKGLEAAIGMALGKINEKAGVSQSGQQNQQQSNQKQSSQEQQGKQNQQSQPSQQGKQQQQASSVKDKLKSAVSGKKDQESSQDSSEQEESDNDNRRRIKIAKSTDEIKGQLSNIIAKRKNGVQDTSEAKKRVIRPISRKGEEIDWGEPKQAESQPSSPKRKIAMPKTAARKEAEKRITGDAKKQWESFNKKVSDAAAERRRKQLESERKELEDAYARFEEETNPYPKLAFPFRRKKK